MKQPRIITVEQLVADWRDFDVVLDARTPAEFAEDHLPGAENAPVLSDQQRIDIGTLYKQVSGFEAKKRGAALTARNIADYIEQYCLDKPRDWKPLVYCWRGGNRSGSLAIILAQIGFPVAQLEGGYKAFRTRVIGDLESWPSRYTFSVLCGPTGSGKSRLLQSLAARGEQVLDLEELANHRGSVLGPVPDSPQPSQKQFETRLWSALQGFDPQRTVWVECESKKVGNVRVPDTLMDHIRRGLCVNINASLQTRVALLRQDYPHWQNDIDRLMGRLRALTEALGHDAIAELERMAQSGQWDLLVSQLLENHYDPAYLKSIARNFSGYPQALQIELSGTADEATALCADSILKASRQG